MSITLRKQDAMIRRLIQAVTDLAEKTKNPEIAQSLRDDIALIDCRPVSIDGRATSWSPERREEFGKKVSETWARKREEKEHGTIYYLWRYRDQEPEKIGTLTDLVAHTRMSIKTVKAKLIDSPDGLVFNAKTGPLIYALDADAMDRLRHAPAQFSGNTEDIIHLPSKTGAKRY